MNPLKLLHISDLHHGKFNTIGRRTTRIAMINARYPNHAKIATGDITDNGTEYASIAGMQGWFVVPGNHDMEAWGIFFPKRKKARAFDAQFYTRFAQEQLPYILPDYDHEVVVLGLNSNPLAWQLYINFARGNIGVRQRRHLARLLQAYAGWTRVVCLHHHPFTRNPWMALADSKKLMTLLTGNCEVLLFGHKHAQELYTIGTAGRRFGIPVTHAAGALYAETHALELTIENGKVTTQYVEIV